jgi:hypothetical protein
VLCSHSAPAIKHEFEAPAERIGPCPQGIQVGASLVGDQVQPGTGIGNPKEGDEIDLAAPGILARRLPDDGGLALDIQQVVDNLVGQSKVMGEGQ